MISANESCKIRSFIPGCTSPSCYATHVLLLTSGCTGGESRDEIFPAGVLCLPLAKHIANPGQVTDLLVLWSGPPRGQLFTRTGSPTSHFLGRSLDSVILAPPSLQRGNMPPSLAPLSTTSTSSGLRGGPKDPFLKLKLSC